MNCPISEEALENIDVMAVKKDGSLCLIIVTTGKLESNTVTEERLLEKINNYLGYINSEDFIEAFGEPDPSRVEIKVSCKKGISQGISEMLENIKDQVASWNATLVYSSE